MINRINLIKNDDHVESELIRKIEIKVVISYGIVKVAFMLCFLPLFIGTLYQEVVAGERIDRAMASQILSTVASVSACVNSGVILGGVNNKTKKKKKTNQWTKSSNLNCFVFYSYRRLFWNNFTPFFLLSCLNQPRYETGPHLGVFITCYHLALLLFSGVKERYCSLSSLIFNRDTPKTVYTILRVFC